MEANAREREAREFVAHSCNAMDELDFARFLGMCDPSFSYKITAYSPEIRRQMVWLEKDKNGLKVLLDLLPQQNMDKTPITRHASISTVAPAEEEDCYDVVSNLQVFRTEMDGGVTTLYAVGKFHDRIKLNGGEPKFVAREVRLDTRMLGTGYHIPF